MKNLSRSIQLQLVIWLCLFFSVNNAFADRVSRFTLLEKRLSALFEPYQNQMRTLNLKARLPGFGAVRIQLQAPQPRAGLSYDRQADGRDEIDLRAVLLSRGQIKLSGKDHSVPVAAAFMLDQGILKVRLNFFDKEDLYATSFEVRRNHTLRNILSSVERANVKELKRHKCASSAPQSSSTAASSALESLPPAAMRSVELATEADYELYQRYGADTNFFIASIVNATNLIYESTLGVSIKVVQQRVQTFPLQPYQSIYAEELLGELKQNMLNQELIWADVFHLFSGKTLQDNVLGVAYTGVVCSEYDYRFGLTQYFDGLSEYLVFAHELAHNFGATHDDISPSNLMSSVLDMNGISFSKFSVRQVSSYISRYSQCLYKSGPPLQELSLSVRKHPSRKRFYRLQLKMLNDQGWFLSELVEIFYRHDAQKPFALLGRVLVDNRGGSVLTRLRGEYMVRWIGQATPAQAFYLSKRGVRIYH